MKNSKVDIVIVIIIWIAILAMGYNGENIIMYILKAIGLTIFVLIGLAVFGVKK